MSIHRITVKAVPWSTLLRHMVPRYLPAGEGGAQVQYIPLPRYRGSSKSKGFKPPTLGLLPKPPSAACPAFFPSLFHREGASHSFFRPRRLDQVKICLLTPHTYGFSLALYKTSLSNNHYPPGSCWASSSCKRMKFHSPQKW